MINVPRLPELSAINLGREVAKDPTLKLYLPDLNNGRQLNRQYLFNVSEQILIQCPINIDH